MIKLVNLHKEYKIIEDKLKKDYLNFIQNRHIFRILMLMN